MKKLRQRKWSLASQTVNGGCKGNSSLPVKAEEGLSLQAGASSCTHLNKVKPRYGAVEF